MNKLFGGIFDYDNKFKRLTEVIHELEDPNIWMCLDCYVCYELCPMRVGLVEVFTILRNLAKKNTDTLFEK